MSFVKLDTGILNSTLWIQRSQREVFITALLMAEPRQLLSPANQIAVDSLDETGFAVPPGWYGFVPASGPGIATRALVPWSEAKIALAELGNPEPESRSKDFAGRRLVRIDGGYVILNYMKYRDYDHGAAARMRMLRRRRSGNPDPSENGDLLDGVTRTGVTLRRTVTEAETEAETEAKEKEKAKIPARSRSAGVTFDQFMKSCEDQKEKPLPPEDPVFAYAARIKLPIEFLRYAWREFAEKYQPDDRVKQKGARGWRLKFGKCVRENWYRLWFQDERHDWALTTAGKQAQRAHPAAPRSNGVGAYA